MRTWRGVCWLVALLPVLGCKGARWDTPEAAYTTFAQAVLKGDAKVAYEGLSEATRKEIEARSKEIAAASQGSVRDDPVLLTFAVGSRPRLVTRVKRLKLEGAVATVAVTAGDETREQRLVDEGGRWKVDLTEILKK